LICILDLQWEKRRVTVSFKYHCIIQIS